MHRGADNRLLIGYVSAATLLLHLLLIPLWAAWLDRGVGEGEGTPLRAKCEGGCEEEDARLVQLNRRACDTVAGMCEPPEASKRTRVQLVVAEAPRPDPSVRPPTEVEEKVEEPEEEKPEPEPEEETPKQFTVLAEKPLVEVIPDEARFAATHSTRAEKETVAYSNDLGSGKGERKPGAMVAPGRPSPNVTPPTPLQKPKKPRKPRKPKNKKPPKGAPDFEEIMAREAAAAAPQEVAEEGVTPKEVAEGDPGREGRPNGAPEPPQPIDLTELAAIDPELHREALDTMGGGGGGGSIDYLNDVAEGDKTVLNRKRSAYAGFFERVTVGIRNHWSPVKVYRRRDPTGRVYGVLDRVTVLRVTLNGNGDLVSLHVEQPCGLDFLDDEAVRAVREAAPFPNPPEGLKDAGGRIQFSFGFHFEISTRKQRLFRFK